MISLAMLPALFVLPYGKILASLILIELLIQIVFSLFYLFRRLTSCLASIRTSPFGIFSSSFKFSTSKAFSEVLQAFEFLTISEYSTPISLVSLGIHYQSMLKLLNCIEAHSQILVTLRFPRSQLASLLFLLGALLIILIMAGVWIRLHLIYLHKL